MNDQDFFYFTGGGVRQRGRWTKGFTVIKLKEYNTFVFSNNYKIRRKMSDDYSRPDVNHFKLSFRIHKVTSQDENFPVTELLISNGQNLETKVRSLFL